VYSGKCRNLTLAERDAAAEKWLETNRGPASLRSKLVTSRSEVGALRVRVPAETVALVDGCPGAFSQNLAAECGDFIVRRSDGVFAYQLAASADDGAMGVTEVVRGRDLLSSAPRQMWLLQRLGYTPPHYCHAPLLLAPDGRRLSKRDRDTTVGGLRAAGVRPEAIGGLLAGVAGIFPDAGNLPGGSTPGPYKQAIAAEELVAGFSWERVHKEDVRLPEGYAEGLTAPPKGGILKL
jgi:glutamyl-tRNA synthetase